MQSLKSKTITTLEVAEMMEISHKELLRKMDGAKDRKGYVQILTENQMALSDYFILSTYKDASGKENKCYEVTKLGCDFLANKSTGEKGVLFTARYVKRFYELEREVKTIPPTERPGEVANLLKVLGKTMRREGLPEYKVAENERMICEQYGIGLVSDYVKIPAYEQIELPLSSIKGEL